MAEQQLQEQRLKVLHWTREAKGTELKLSVPPASENRSRGRRIEAGCSGPEMSLQPGGSRTLVCPGVTALFPYITNHPQFNGFKQHHFVHVSIILEGLYKKTEREERRKGRYREGERKEGKEEKGRKGGRKQKRKETK